MTTTTTTTTTTTPRFLGFVQRFREDRRRKTSLLVIVPNMTAEQRSLAEELFDDTSVDLSLARAAEYTTQHWHLFKTRAMGERRLFVMEDATVDWLEEAMQPDKFPAAVLAWQLEYFVCHCVTLHLDPGELEALHAAVFNR